MGNLDWMHVLLFGVGLAAGYYVIAHYKKTGSSY